MDAKNHEIFSVCYSPVDTPILGRIWIAASSGGVFLLDFSEREGDFLSALNKNLGHFSGTAELRLDPTDLSVYLDAVLSYFDYGTPIPENLPVNISYLTEFQRKVLGLVKEIPMGTITTYGDLARQLDNELAARAVGQVLRANPLPVIIPCHRVVRADGSVGGYGGILGSQRKIALLKHEGVILA